jgi:hypothetical protein
MYQLVLLAVKDLRFLDIGGEKIQNECNLKVTTALFLNSSQETLWQLTEHD